MRHKDQNGQSVYSQYDIERETGLSRPYIRKLARQVGYQFPRNGVEVKGTLCMCAACGSMFRKPPSRVKRAKNQFCSEECRIDWTKGENHGAWIDGRSASSFSRWAANQSEYAYWKEQVLQRGGYKCAISGRTDNLECHHIKPKATNHEFTFDPDNGMVLNEDVHIEMHKLIREGKSFEESQKILKEKYEYAENETKV